MKKLILLFTVAAFFLTPATNAQFVKGNWMAEGGIGNLSVSNNTFEQTNVSGARIDYNKTKDFSIGIMPRMGYFVTNNLVVGTTFGINFSSTNVEELNASNGVKVTETKRSSIHLDFMPFLRYYFGKTGTTRFYGQVGCGITTALSTKGEYKEFDNIGAVDYTSKLNTPKKYFNFSGEALVGLNHFVSQNVAINAALGYRHISGKETTSYTNTLGIPTTTPEVKHTIKGGTFSWNVGFTMIIPCKKKGK